MYQEINSNTVLLQLCIYPKVRSKDIMLPVNNTTATFYQKTKFLPLVLKYKAIVLYFNELA